MPRDGQTIACEWFSAAELAALALPGMPTTKGKVLEMAKRQDWQRPAWEGTHWRLRAGRGGGIEYHLAVLPMVARAKLAFAEHQAAQEPAHAHAEGLWDWYARQPTTKKAKAEARLKALDAVETLVRAGERRVQAMQMIAAEQKIALSSLYEWTKLTHGLAREDWLPALAPRHAGGRESADLPDEAWEMLKGDFLRPERPNFTACYRRLQRVAATEGWQVPAERTLHRRMMAIPEHQRVLLRDGVDALRRMFPAQQRDRGVFHALEAVNADGHTWDVFVKWPDGTIGRPHMVAFQDLYSGKILSFRVDVALSWHAVRLAFGDMVEGFGIPRLCWLDNGREFAAKRITGGQKTRYRFKVKDEEPEGLMTTMGVEVHWTTPYHGQAKPIERAFRDLAQDAAKHPAFAGAYTGNSPTAKPDNYGKSAVPLDEFLRVISEEIAEHNARAGRRSPICAGRSFDETFAASYAVSPIQRASAEQRRLWLLAAEAVRPRAQDGAIHLYGNRYWAEFLHAQRGSQVVARFDPDALAEAMHIYAADGRYLGAAECLEAAGFNSVSAAQDQARRWKQYLRATRQGAEALNRMSIAEVARKLPQIEAAEPPEPRVVQPIFAGNNALKALPRAEPERDEESDRVMEALRAQPLRQFRIVEDDE
jgi:putative transposase